jgi:hypothetical protein
MNRLNTIQEATEMAIRGEIGCTEAAELSGISKSRMSAIIRSKGYRYNFFTKRYESVTESDNVTHVTPESEPEPITRRLESYAAALNKAADELEIANRERQELAEIRRENEFLRAANEQLRKEIEPLRRDSDLWHEEVRRREEIHRHESQKLAEKSLVRVEGLLDLRGRSA